MILNFLFGLGGDLHGRLVFGQIELLLDLALAAAEMLASLQVFKRSALRSGHYD
jgi:hypothetical protein